MSTWPASGASPASRSRSATAAARFPPALSPHTATDCGDTPKRSAFAERPSRHALAVVEPRRVRVLRSQPVLDRDDDGTGAVRELARDVVHQADAAHDVAATVEVHDETGRGALAAVDPDRHPVDDVVGDGRDLARSAGSRPGPAPARAARAAAPRTARRAPGSRPPTRRPTDRAHPRRSPARVVTSPATPSPVAMMRMMRRSVPTTDDHCATTTSRHPQHASRLGMWR